MDEQTKAHYDLRAMILKALAHPARLFIVDQLAEHESTVGELTAKIGSDISTVSKHLSVLKQSGIVLADKRGQQVYYILKTPCIRNFFGCIETVIRTNASEQLETLCYVSSTPRDT